MPTGRGKVTSKGGGAASLAALVFKQKTGQCHARDRHRHQHTRTLYRRTLSCCHGSCAEAKVFLVRRCFDVVLAHLFQLPLQPFVLFFDLLQLELLLESLVLLAGPL